MIKKILDFSPSSHSDIVERILINIHKVIDIEFPNASEAPTRFSKTVFNDDESTGLVKAAKEYDKQLNKTKNNSQEHTNPPHSSIDAETKENKPDEALEEHGLDTNENLSHLNTQQGIEFSQMYSAIDNKAVRGTKDLVMVLVGLLVLAMFAGAYWYFFESNTTY